jgi:hypothetical protein
MNENTIEIIKCGTFVILKLANLKGMITCCAIRFQNIVYEVTYYCGADQKTIWVNQNEFDVDEPDTQKIGFKK